MREIFNIDHFANPEALFLLALIPIYLFWYYRFFKKQRLVIRLSYDPARMQKPRFSLTLLRVVPHFLQLTALALMIIAIARPQTAREVQTRMAEGIDIMMLLDTSGSMETDDFLPSRLEVAKRMATRFIDGRADDRIGMVLFAEGAFSYAPLTLDHDFLKEMVKDINSRILPPQGTAIGTAIAVGINRMRDSENTSRIMIMITDGANNRGKIDPVTAAKLAREHGIRLYCIGIGQPEGVVAASQSSGVELDEASLIRMANITGGSYFRASHSERLQEVFETISRLETRQVEENTFRLVEDHYPGLLKIAMVLLGISFLLMLTFVYNPLAQ